MENLELLQSLKVEAEVLFQELKEFESINDMDALICFGQLRQVQDKIVELIVELYNQK